MRKQLEQARAKRDQEPSEFTRILEDLVRRSPGVHGAALVDSLGEAVDYAGTLDPFEVKVAAAHMRILLDEAAAPAFASCGTPKQIVTRAERKSFLVRALAEGYAIVVVLRRHGFGLSARALASAEREISREARLDVDAGPRAEWHAVEVETLPKDRRRPQQIRVFGGPWHSLEVMGSLVGLRGRERGYRVRLRTGAELTLVREPLGRWYADEPLGDPEPKTR